MNKELDVYHRVPGDLLMEIWLTPWLLRHSTTMFSTPFFSKLIFKSKLNGNKARKHCEKYLTILLFIDCNEINKNCGNLPQISMSQMLVQFS